MDHPPRSLTTTLCFILLLLLSNFITFSIFSSSNNNPFFTTTPSPSPTSHLETTLSQTQSDLKQALAALQTLLHHLSSTTFTLPTELLQFTSPKPLPFGHNPNFDSSTIYPPIGHPCSLFSADLQTYMSYQPHQSCPDDELLAQRLLLKGCEPLPRRRCRPLATPNYVEPLPLPNSLWSTPHDSNVHWTAYTCKNYSCLIHRKNQKGFDDCKDCFDLEGREKHRWAGPGGELDFGIDEVLAAKNRTIRIGLDIGGGSGTFAVRMKERDVTIVTTSMNFNGPFNSFIASRGVVPLYITVSQRLPFFDNTLDIVHSMHVLSNWIPTKLLEFIFFDIYRILRPGGVFWLDHFFCIEDQLEVYIPILEGVGFHKMKWVVGRKLDRGPEMREMYISALLEKPGAVHR